MPPKWCSTQVLVGARETASEHSGAVCFAKPFHTHGDIQAKTGVRIPVGALKRIELFDIPVEQFFALIHFENRERLKYLIQFTQGT